MSKWFWEKLAVFVGFVAIALFFVLVFIDSNIEIKDYDLWLHLASGKYILSHFTIPQVDVFSCTIAGKPWVNHEWLFQVLLFTLYSSFGAQGMISLQAAVVTISFILILFLGYSKSRQPVVLGLLILVLLVYETRFTIRPDIFSLLFFVVYFYILAAHLMQRWTLLALFFVQVLWTNIHGFFIAGPLLILISLFAEWMKRKLPLPWEWKKVGCFENDELRQLFKILGVVILACFLNPYGWDGLLYPIKVMSSFSGESKIFFQWIKELQKPITHWQEFLPQGDYAPYKWLIILSGFSFILNYRKIDIGVLLFWLIFLIFSLNALRNMALFAFCAYIVIIINCSRWSFQEIFSKEWFNSKWIPIIYILINLGFIGWMGSYLDKLSYHGYFDFDKLERKSEFGGISLRSFPYKAVDFLKENKISGNFFNDFNSGAYLLGRVYPEIKVFIDGRTEEYGAKFFEDYRMFLKGRADIVEPVIEKYNLTGAYIGYVTDLPPFGLIKYFYDHKEWVLVYFDYDAIIFLKDIPLNRTVNDKYSLNLAERIPDKLDLIKIGMKNIPAYQYAKRSSILLNLKLYDQALAEAYEGLRIDANSSEIYKALGRIYLEKRDYQSALEFLRKARVLSSQEPEIRYYLGRAFYYLGDLDQALEQAQFVLRANSNNVWGLVLMAEIEAKQRKYDHFLERVLKIKDFYPEYSEIFRELGDLLFDQNQFEQAKKVFILTANIGGDQRQIKDKINLCDEQMKIKVE